jgi:anti-sigma factor RsiW
MAAERYLLDELEPEAREAFEEHVFDCPECALDLRAAAAFVDEAKVQLPALAESAPAPPTMDRPRVKRDWWLAWTRPAFAVPAFATLLLVLGFENLVTLPRLRTEAAQPRLLAWVPLRGDMRGTSAAPIAADREHGVALSLDLSQQPGVAPYPTYSFDLLDPQGKLAWTGVAAAPPASDAGVRRIVLVIPGTSLRNGSYTVAVFGVGPGGERTQVEKYLFELVLISK